MIEMFHNADPLQVVSALRKLPAYRHTIFEIGDLDNETASDLGNVLATVHEQFAGKFKVTAMLTETMGPNNLATTRRTRSGEIVVRLNRARFQDRRALQFVLGIAFATNRFAGADVIHIFMHEAAHVLQDSPGVGLHHAKAYVRSRPPSAMQLSRRATKNRDEALAEGFAKVMRTAPVQLNDWQMGFRDALNLDIAAVGGIILRGLP